MSFTEFLFFHYYKKYFLLYYTYIYTYIHAYIHAHLMEKLVFLKNNGWLDELSLFFLVLQKMDQILSGPEDSD